MGWSYIIILGWFLLFEGRFYYLLPIYPMLLAAGAVFLEPRLQHTPAWKYTTLIALLTIGLALMPIALPLMPSNRSAYVTPLGNIVALLYLPCHKKTKKPAPTQVGEGEGRGTTSHWQSFAAVPSAGTHGFPCAISGAPAAAY